MSTMQRRGKFEALHYNVRDRMIHSRQSYRQNPLIMNNKSFNAFHTNQKTKSNNLFVCNLLLSQSSRCDEYASFSQVLQQSLSVEKTTPAFCENCKKFTPTNQYARVTKLPEILSVNCGLTSEREITFLGRQINQNGGAAKTNDTKSEPINNAATTSKPCRYGVNCSRFDCHFAHSNRKSPSETQHTTPTNTNGNTSVYQPWFPHDLKLSIEAETGNLVVKSSCDEDSKSTSDNQPEQTEDGEENTASTSTTTTSTSQPTIEEKAYKLTSIVCQISNGNQRSLVALIYVDSNYHKAKISNYDSNVGQWYIFNDFR